MTRGDQTLSHPAFRSKTFAVGQKPALFLRGSPIPLLHAQRAPVAVVAVNRTDRVEGRRALPHPRSLPRSLPGPRPIATVFAQRFARAPNEWGARGVLHLGTPTCQTLQDGESHLRLCRLTTFLRLSAPTARCHSVSPRPAPVNLSQASSSRSLDTTFTSHDIGT